MPVVRPHNPRTRWTLWGESLAAIAAQLPSASSVERFLTRNRFGVELSVKPYHFARFVSGEKSIDWCLQNHSMLYLAQEQFATYDGLLAEAHRLGLKVDLNWDPHDDGVSGPNAYHRNPLTSPYPQRSLFPFTATQSVEDAKLCAAIVNRIELLYPGTVARVTAANEPFYQPGWSVRHTPAEYGQWVLDLHRELDRSTSALIELVASGQEFGNTGKFGQVWQATHFDRITTGVHFLFPTVPQGTPPNQVANEILIDLDATYQKAIRDRAPGIDVHAMRWASDELFPSGRAMAAGVGMVGTDSEVSPSVYQKTLDWHDHHGISYSLLSVGGASPIYSQPWNVEAGLIHPDGRWTTAANAIDQMYSGGGGNGIDSEDKPMTPEERKDFAQLADLKRRNAQADKNYDKDKIEQADWRAIKTDIQDKAKKLQDKYS